MSILYLFSLIHILIRVHLESYSSVYLFYNRKIIDPCGTYIHSQVNTGINVGIIYNWLTLSNLNYRTCKKHTNKPWSNTRTCTIKFLELDLHTGRQVKLLVQCSIIMGHELLTAWSRYLINLAVFFLKLVSFLRAHITLVYKCS